MVSEQKKIENELHCLANEQIAVHSQKFFKTGAGQYGEGDRFLGIRVPVLRKIARRYRRLDLPSTEKLLHSEFHEIRLTALLILVECYKRGDERLQKEVYELYLKNSAYINNWDLVDVSAPHIVGHFLEHRDRDILSTLAVSDNLWERRIAILATFHFIRRNSFTETLKLADILRHDEHDLLHKAVGWMLREVGNRDLDREVAFLDEHYKELPRTMLRYAIERFPESLRQAYLKGTR
ncbi:MAG: DNA alkylation repair protein [Desulfocapsaceae bacterium]